MCFSTHSTNPSKLLPLPNLYTKSKGLAQLGITPVYILTCDILVIYMKKALIDVINYIKGFADVCQGSD